VHGKTPFSSSSSSTRPREECDPHTSATAPSALLKPGIAIQFIPFVSTSHPSSIVNQQSHWRRQDRRHEAVRCWCTPCLPFLSPSHLCLSIFHVAASPGSHTTMSYHHCSSAPLSPWWSTSTSHRSLRPRPELWPNYPPRRPRWDPYLASFPFSPLPVEFHAP
jgi:hypothetical protein